MCDATLFCFIPLVFSNTHDTPSASVLARNGERCVCDLTVQLQLSQPKISRHLALLRTQGLLSDRRQGQWVYYQLAAELPEWAQHIIQTIAAERDDLSLPPVADCC